MNEWQLLVGAALILGLGYLLLKFGQTIAKFLLAVGGLMVAGIIGLAMLEQAKATRAVATTASIAATGQAATSASLSAAVVLILVLLLAAGGVAAYLYFRHRRQRARAAWLPGPYAYWGQVGQMPAQPVQPAVQYPPAPAYPTAVYPPALPAQTYPPVPAYPYPWPVVYYLPPESPEEDDNALAVPWW